MSAGLWVLGGGGGGGSWPLGHNSMKLWGFPALS